MFVAISVIKRCNFGTFARVIGIAVHVYRDTIVLYLHNRLETFPWSTYVLKLFSLILGLVGIDMPNGGHTERHNHNDITAGERDALLASGDIE